MAVSRRHAVETRLLRAWSGTGALSTLLLPLSWLYGGLVRLRRILYQLDALRAHKVPALVIVVGNVIAGGAGKTPTTIAVVQHLLRLGYGVGIVSRGFGRRSTELVEVTADRTVAETGDEPMLMYRATGAPVVVGRDRVRAAHLLLHRHPKVQIIVCDDGLQHYALVRDLEICVFDDRGCGNGRLLPAGPLRESWPRAPLGMVASGQELLVLHTGSKAAFQGFSAQRALRPFAVTRDGTRIALQTLSHPPGCVAVAGIAQPEAFFAMLRDAGIHLHACLPLPDHYDFDSLPRNIYEGYRLICTEKDAEKLWAMDPDALAVGLDFQPCSAFFEALDRQVLNALKGPVSSNHGHPTT